MALNINRFSNALQIIPKAVSSIGASGELEFISGTNKLQLHNGSTISPVVTEAHQATLTNKLFSDSTVFFADNADVTKLFQFQASGITAGQNRVLTVPDADFTIVGVALTQTLTNKALQDSTTTIVDNADATKAFKFEASSITTATTRTLTIPDADFTLMGLALQQTVTNKLLSDSTVLFADNSDATKKMGFELSGITTATTRTLTVPDADFTLMGLALQQTVTNKLLSDSTVIFADNADTTKRMNFEVSGVTAGQTRVLTVPDADLTIVGTATTQTLTNKTFTDSTTLFQDEADNTKKLALQLSGITTATTRTLTIPDANTTIVGTDATQVLTNKDIDGGTAANTRRLTISQDTVANITALSRKEGTLWYANDVDKFYGDNGSSLFEVGSGSGGSINYILNADAETSTTGWAAYGLTEAVTFTDAGDLVTLASHGLSTGQPVSFSVITTTTGISVGTIYYVIFASSSTFQLASSVALARAGTALPLTTNGTGTILRAIPVTATGGSPNVTLTRTTSSPLRGVGTFVLTKDAANRMGQGCSYDFSIASADKSKPLNISFEYTGSANFVAGSDSTDGDVNVYIYDVTNGVLIQPAGYKLTGGTGNNWKFTSTFQTSTSTSYRLIFHIASVNAGAWTLNFDTVVVGPTVMVNGAIITDWVSYTPTISAGFGTCTNVAFRSRRNGDSLEVIGYFTAGTVAASAATVTIGYNGSNANVVIDGSKVAVGNQIVGTGAANTTPSATYFGYISCIVASGATTAVGLGVQNSAVGAGVTQNGNSVTGTGNIVSIQFRVPILGWGSTVSLSNDTDTRVVTALYKTATGTLNGSDNLLTYTSKQSDTHGCYASGLYTIPVAGFYDIQGRLSINGTIGSGVVTQLLIYIDGAAAYQEAHQFAGAGAANAYMKIDVKGVPLRAGQTVALYSNAGTVTGPTIGGGTNLNFFSIARQSGPATIAAAEKIACHYRTSAGQSIPNSGDNLVVFGTRVYDTHGAFNSSTGVFTCPRADKYRISTAILYASAAATVGNTYYIAVYKTGVNYERIFSKEIEVTRTGFYGGNGTTTLDCLAGDTIDIRLFYNRTGGATTLETTATNQFIAIESI